MFVILAFFSSTGKKVPALKSPRKNLLRWRNYAYKKRLFRSMTKWWN